MIGKLFLFWKENLELQTFLENFKDILLKNIGDLF